VKRTGESFPDRARWLQSLARSGQHGHLYSQVASSSISNVEHLFSTTRIDDLSDLARRMVSARNVFILGLGTCFSVAHGFWYVGRMAVDNFTLLPQHGALPMDDVSRLSNDDVLVVISFNPYRSEVTQSARLAKERGAYVVSITDSQASPASIGAVCVFMTPTRTPQIFASMQAATALLEALLAFIIAESGPGVIDRINAFHRLREETGAYERGIG
jgi:DNA-binding MurR/RpiR family transcriptional regulator